MDEIRLPPSHSVELNAPFESAATELVVRRGLGEQQLPLMTATEPSRSPRGTTRFTRPQVRERSAGRCTCWRLPGRRWARTQRVSELALVPGNPVSRRSAFPEQHQLPQPVAEGRWHSCSEAGASGACGLYHRLPGAAGTDRSISGADQRTSTPPRPCKWNLQPGEVFSGASRIGGGAWNLLDEMLGVDRRAISMQSERRPSKAENAAEAFSTLLLVVVREGAPFR